MPESFSDEFQQCSLKLLNLRRMWIILLMLIFTLQVTYRSKHITLECIKVGSKHCIQHLRHGIFKLIKLSIWVLTYCRGNGQGHTVSEGLCTVITTVCADLESLVWAPLHLTACMLIHLQKDTSSLQAHFLYFGNEDVVLTAYTEKRNKYKLGLDRWLGC